MKDKDKPKFRVGQRVMYTSPVGRKYNKIIVISKVEWYEGIVAGFWMYFISFAGCKIESYTTEEYLKAISCPMK